MKKILSFGGVMTALTLFVAFIVVPAQAATTWNTTGTYVLDMNYLGTDYPTDMSLTQDSFDNLSGNGGSPAGANTYTWVINSGTVVNDTINFTANYTATPDAVTPQTVLTVAGVIAQDGTFSGTWSDNYAGGQRNGTFTTASGSATTTATTTPSNATSSKVTILKYVDGSMATASSTDNADFQMMATFVINGTPGTGQYALSENGYNGNTTPYQAMTGDLPNGSDYSTNEMMDSVVGTTCTSSTTPFALIGYTSGNTLQEAQSASSTLVAPSFVNMQSDKFVIVWNDDCSTTGQIVGEVVTGTGTLAVTSIEVTDSSATANGTYEDGWEYVFNITIPTNETDVSMRFSDWVMTSGSSTIPAGGNMRISSAQANNGGATIPITAANTYSSPALTMTTDLNPSLDGMQVQIVVEVKIPTGTQNGSYSTNYGVRSE